VRLLVISGAVLTGGLTVVLASAQILSAGLPTDVLPPSKQALVDMEQANRSAGHPPDKAQDPGGPLILQTDEPAPVGLLGVLDAPISGSEFTATNAWAGWVAGEYVRVWVGAPSEAPAKGLLLMIRQAGSNGSPTWNGLATTSLIAVPLRGGPPRIQSAANDRLLIASPAGSTVLFDVSAGVFN
jgi:hypothetical protein